MTLIEKHSAWKWVLCGSIPWVHSHLCLLACIVVDAPSSSTHFARGFGTSHMRYPHNVVVFGLPANSPHLWNSVPLDKLYLFLCFCGTYKMYIYQKLNCNTSPNQFVWQPCGRHMWTFPLKDRMGWDEKWCWWERRVFTRGEGNCTEEDGGVSREGRETEEEMLPPSLRSVRFTSANSSGPRSTHQSQSLGRFAQKWLVLLKLSWLCTF